MEKWEKGHVLIFLFPLNFRYVSIYIKDKSKKIEKKKRMK